MIQPEMKTPPADTASAVTNKYTEAYNLNVRICINAQIAQQNLYEVCKGLKEMRDGKLYKELGYRNFEDYTENEVGIKHSQAYKMISIAEKLPENSFHPGGKIGLSKLYLLSTLSEEERTEITVNNDVAEMSKRELEEKIKEIRSLQSQLDDTGNTLRKISSEKKELAEKNAELEQLVEELESRPVEVAVQSDTTEIEKLNSIIKQTDLDWGKKYSELEEENIKLRQEDFRKHAAEIEQLKSEYERRLSEAENASSAEPVPDTKEVFKAYLSNAVDAVKRLLSFVQKYPDEKIFRDKTKELFNNINQNMEV